MDKQSTTIEVKEGLLKIPTYEEMSKEDLCWEAHAKDRQIEHLNKKLNKYGLKYIYLIIIWVLFSALILWKVYG